MGRLVSTIPRAEYWPLFDGLKRTRVSADDIATIAGVSARAVHDWSRGHAHMPPVILALLTFVLESTLEETERLHIGYGAATPAWRRGVDGRLEPIRRCLRKQHVRNAALPAAAVLQGRRLFYGWSSRKRSTRHVDAAGRTPGSSLSSIR